MSTSMAYGRKGGKEGAAEDMGKGKGKGKDMVKGWGSLPKQSSHLPHMHLFQRAQAYETETRTFEQQQVEFAEDKAHQAHVACEEKGSCSERRPRNA